MLVSTDGWRSVKKMMSLHLLKELIESQVINPHTESNCHEIEEILESVSTVNFTCLRACDELRDKHLQKVRHHPHRPPIVGPFQNSISIF